MISQWRQLGFISSLNELTKDLRQAPGHECARGEQAGCGQRVDGELDSGLKTPAADRATAGRRLDRRAGGRVASIGNPSAPWSRRRPSEDARSKLGATADNAVARIAEIEKVLLQGDSVTQFNSVIELSKLIQQARFQVRGYTYSAKVEAEQPALEAIANALKSADSLRSQLPEQYGANLQEASGLPQGLSRRRQPVPRLPGRQRRGAQAMVSKATAVGPGSKKMTAHQTVIRDNDAAQAKFLLMLAPPGIVLRIVAACDYRQIVIPWASRQGRRALAAGDRPTTWCRNARTNWANCNAPCKA